MTSDYSDLSRTGGAILIIPARNEADSLPGVLSAIPPCINRVIVVDNGSSDQTARIARRHGAQVVYESRRGYGSACLAGLAALKSNPPHIVLFADGDGSDDLSSLTAMIDIMAENQADMVLAQRIPVEGGAMSPQQRFGNALAVSLIRRIWGHHYCDLGPMRCITWNALQSLDMRDRAYGWTVEMQVKAIQNRLRIVEIPSPYRKRVAGKSKISRTLGGTCKAGGTILWVIARELFCGKFSCSSQ